MSRSFLFLWIVALVCLMGISIGCGDDDDDDDDSTDDDDDDDTTDNPFDEIPIDQTYNFTDLTGNVEVIFDDWGIPHIYAANNHDLMYVLGYVTSTYRFFQMDFLRHLTSGRLTEYFGSLAGLVLEQDVAMRTLFLSPNGELVFKRIEPLLSQDEVDLLNAFCDGVNAYIADIQTSANGQVAPEEYDHTLFNLAGTTVQDIPEWTIDDVFAIARLQQWDLSHSASAEVRLGEKFNALPSDVLTDVVRFKPVEDTVILEDFFPLKKAQSDMAVPDAIAGMDPARIRAALDHMSDFVRLHGLARQDESVGSNNWVVDKDHTSTGNPLLANDPHLGFLNPSVFMEVGLNTALFGTENTLSAYGVEFPGIPALMIGTNENLAWGVTTVGYDVEDVYIETLNDANPALATAALFNGNQVDIEYSDQEFKLGSKPGASVETVSIPYLPHHGPFLNGSLEASGGMTNRWTGHEPTNDLPAFLNLLWAENVDDFMDATNHFQVGAQNFVAIDSTGAIAYNPHSKVPIRDDGATPWVPMSGEGDFEWVGYLDDVSVPHAKNPDAGYIITANNDVAGNLQDNDPANDDAYLLWDAAVGFRASRVTELLTESIESKGDLTMDRMREIQNDTLSTEARRFIQFLFDAADAKPDMVTDLGLGDALTRLEDWDFSTPIGITGVDGTPATSDEVANSVATTIFYAYWTMVPYLTFADEFDNEGAVAYNVGRPGRDAIWYLLENLGTSETGEELFDNTDTVAVETHEDILLTALDLALDWLASADGFNTADMNQWNWGRIHTTQWEDFFSNFSDLFTRDVKGPYPIDGAPYTVDVASCSGFQGYDGMDMVFNFTNGSGAQVRWNVEFTPDGLVAKNVIPGGEVGKVGDDHYNDQAELWLTNQVHDVRFYPEDVAANAEARWVFMP